MKTFKHGGRGGDMIFGLATMYHMNGGIIYLNRDRNEFYRELLERQDYVEEAKHLDLGDEDWAKFKADVNLDLFRSQNYNRYTLIECHARAQNIKFDFTKPWVFNIEPKEVAPIVINDTGNLRFPGYTIDWMVLEEFKDDCIFIGLPHEHANFVRNKFDVKRYYIKNAYEFARIIKGSKLYVGNQSVGAALAEAMKVVRFIDMYVGKSKQYPFGEHGFIRINKKLIERYNGTEV